MKSTRRLLLLMLAGGAFALLVPPVAPAGPAGKWTKLTGPQSSSSEVGLARTADGTLHVLWPGTVGAARTANHSSLSANAKTKSGPNVIFTYPSAINEDMDLIVDGNGGLRAFFSGLFATESEPLQGLMTTATSSDGGSWAVQPTPASSDLPSGTSSVYAANGISAVRGPDGVPISVWGDTNAGYHVGVSDATPDVRFSSACCVYDPDLGVDAVSGEVVLGWHYLQGANGTAYQSISPAGPASDPPGAHAGGTGTRTAISGRLGAAGVYLAYQYGSNEFSSIPAVVRTGTTKVIKFTHAKGAEDIGIAPAPGGRMWVFWKRSEKIVAARSNTAMTRFGAMVTLKAPAGSMAIYNLAGEGSRGPLDLLALVAAKAGTDNWHQRILPGLTLAAKSAKGAIKFRVTDAGAPVKSAKVKAGGKSKKTNAKGRATIQLKQGKYKATATKSGYAKGRTSAKSK